MPIAKAERIALLDALRGFALYGILVFNLQVYTGYHAAAHEGYATRITANLDHIATWLSGVLIQGKFYSIFSLLVGIGFAVQERRAMAKGQPFGRLHLRRMAALFAFGMLHSLLLVGDILRDYALAGICLLLFRSTRDRTLLIAAVVLNLLPLAYYALMLVWPAANIGSKLSTAGSAWQASEASWMGLYFLAPYTLDSGWLLIKANVISAVSFYGAVVQSGLTMSVLATFILGYLVGRRGILTQVEHHRRLLFGVLIVGLAIGLPCSILLETWKHRSWIPVSGQGFMMRSIYMAGVVPLSLAYVAGLALLWQRPGFRRLFGILCPAGRMAFTNYLSYTLLAAVFFYGVGFGLYGTISPTLMWPLAALVLALQILWNRAWLARFRYGPFEWLWRQLTYFRRLPLG